MTLIALFAAAAILLFTAKLLVGDGMSDAQASWCRANPVAVGESATALHLDPPQTTASWQEWAHVVLFLGDGGWDGATTELDRGNRNRACVAAFELRR